MFSLIFLAPGNPPVMAVTMRGNSSFFPRTSAVMSMSSMSISGMALCMSLMSSQ